MVLKFAFLDCKNKLNAIYDMGEAAIIAEMMFCALLEVDVLGLKLQFDKMLSESEMEQINQKMHALLQHHPIQYVLGFADFYGMKFKVDASVLIPRSETEELVLITLKWIKNRPLSVLEIGTGSGCIAIALKKNAPQIQVVSVDVSEKALAIARENVQNNNVKVDFIQCDFLDENNWNQLGAYDVIVSNPPYIMTSEADEMEAHVMQHEPHEALFVTNNDAQQFYKKILTFAQQQKTKPSAIFLELNQTFAHNTMELYQSAQWNTTLHKDLNDNWRMLAAFS